MKVLGEGDGVEWYAYHIGMYLALALQILKGCYGIFTIFQIGNSTGQCVRGRCKFQLLQSVFFVWKLIFRCI